MTQHENTRWILSCSELLRRSAELDDEEDDASKNAIKEKMFADFLQEPSTPRCDMACQSIRAWQRTLDFWQVPEEMYPQAYWRLLLPTDFSVGRRRHGGLEQRRRTVANRVRALRRAIASYESGFLRRVLAAFTVASVTRHHAMYYFRVRTHTTADRFDAVVDWCLQLDRFDLLELVYRSAGRSIVPERKELIVAAVMHDSVRCLRGFYGDMDEETPVRSSAAAPNAAASSDSIGSMFVQLYDARVQLRAMRIQVRRMELDIFGIDLCVLAAACQSAKCLEYFLDTVKIAQTSVRDLFWAAFIGANPAVWLCAKNDEGTTVAVPRAEMVKLFRSKLGAGFVDRTMAGETMTSLSELRTKRWVVDENVRHVLVGDADNKDEDEYESDDDTEWY